MVGRILVVDGRWTIPTAAAKQHSVWTRSPKTCQTCTCIHIQSCSQTHCVVFFGRGFRQTSRVLQSHTWRCLGAWCATSCHVACAMVCPDLVDHGWTGGSDHSNETIHTLNALTYDDDAFDANFTILHQQRSDMQLDVGRHIVQSSCVECCVKLLEFAHTSACVCVSCFCASDAHDFFAECFIVCRRSMRRRRVTATLDLQHDTSLRQFFVLGALVPATLLATLWVRHPIDDGWRGQSDHTRTNHMPFLFIVVFSCACFNNM